ncbi:major facilitator superfamily member protein [Babesia caballi]|uniref:Major facilitator superfamily member protein n=1 Tax=Babesia caballi TaxID=5871 RepID=A0AAV4LRT0_BABCB|nr:major facilitator superfamily member protein [Babesia caballi]
MGLGLSPTSLSILATGEIISMVGSSPFWGYLVDRVKLKYALGAAMVMCGIANFALGYAANFWVILALRILHGCALGCTAPAMQKIVTTSTPENKHAGAFGILHAMSCLGRLITAALLTHVAGLTVMGYAAWRVCYVGIGLVWICVGDFVLWFLEPEVEEDAEEVKTEPEKASSVCDTLRGTFKTPSSKLLLFVIFISDAPFSAFTYMVLYLQYVGLSNLNAGIAVALTLVGGFLGGALGGVAVDWCHNKSEDYGRLMAGNVVTGIRLVACLALFLGPSPDGHLTWYMYAELIIIGATMMTVSSIDRPIMASIVEKKYQASATGINRCIAGVLSSALFLPLGGLLAEKAFGYTHTSAPIEEMAEAVKNANADALRQSIMWLIGAGTLINALCYVAFFFLYPKDRIAFQGVPLPAAGAVGTALVQQLESVLVKHVANLDAVEHGVAHGEGSQDELQGRLRPQRDEEVLHEDPVRQVDAAQRPGDRDQGADVEDFEGAAGGGHAAVDLKGVGKAGRGVGGGLKGVGEGGDGLRCGGHNGAFQLLLLLPQHPPEVAEVLVAHAADVASAAV